VGRIDGTSRDNGRPAGVADAFQVRSDSVEPILANRCRNLLSQKSSGSACSNESKKVGPKVPIIGLRFAAAGDGERLTGAGAGPDFAGVGPSSKSSCKGPPANAGEKVTLGEPGEI
jgi:hypothetical protein